LKQKLDIGQKGKNVTQKGKVNLGGVKGKQETRKQAPVDAANPLDNVAYTGDFEHDSQAEMMAMKQALREADKRYNEQRDLTNATEYWFSVVFESQEQKDIFLAAMNWLNVGDKYLDGTLLARLQNIPLPKVKFPAEKPNQRKIFTELVDSDFDN
jgi:hypothetical protein